LTFSPAAAASRTVCATSRVLDGVTIRRTCAFWLPAQFVQARVGADVALVLTASVAHLIREAGLPCGG
jgi:hypothetical protein